MTETGQPVRVFFIHVMKTGGTSLLASFRRNFRADEIYPNPQLDMPADATRRVAFRHATIQHLRTLSDERVRRLRIVSGHFPYVAVEVLGGGFETMTILRHPVERTISLLRQMQRPGSWLEGPQEAPVTASSLEEVYEQSNVYEPLVHDHQTKIFSMTLDDQPRGYLQVIDVDRPRLELAKENLAAVDVVGLTERYDDFLDLVTERFGWSIKRDARANVTPAGSTPVSEALRRRIAADNAIDMELYEFATELVAARRIRRLST